MGGGRSKYKQTNNVENRMVKALDDLAEFEDYKREVLPKLRAMMKEGKSSEELRKFAQSYLTARQITIGLTSEDEATSLRAIDALTHQNEGKPTERQEVEHRFAKLPDQELDALLESRLKEVQDGQQSTDEDVPH